MSEEENKAVIYRHVEVLNKGDLSIVDEIISPDYVYHRPTGELNGRDGFKQIVTMVRNAFPDINYTIDDMVAEGDTVAARYTWTGTFKGELMGMAPTGKQFTMTSAYFYRFSDGKEVEATPFIDLLTFYKQLGIPIPAE